MHHQVNQTVSLVVESARLTPGLGATGEVKKPPAPRLEVGLLTGGIDKPYAYGLSMALTSKDVHVDFIGSDEVEARELRSNTNLKFLNLRGSQEEARFSVKVHRILLYYVLLIRYAFSAKPKVFHILWNNKFQTIDRTALMLYYKALGKKIVFTAHNVNAAKRDGSDSALNRATLKIQYRLADHIFVHTKEMKKELVADFGVSDSHVTVIPFGINNAVPRTPGFTPECARAELGIPAGKKVILFFGRIGPYKGLQFLADAFQRLSRECDDYCLVIAGKPKAGAERYLAKIQESIAGLIEDGRVIQNIGFIPDEQTELYFKAADVVAIPYTASYESGVLFLAYSFGLPVIASDVGSMRDSIVEGRTGLLCAPGDAVGLAAAIKAYFASDLYTNLDRMRQEICAYANARNSWDTVGDVVRNVYARFVEGARQ